MNSTKAKPRGTFARKTIPDVIHHVIKQAHPGQIMIYVALYTSAEWYLYMYETKESVNTESYLKCMQDQFLWQEETS